MVDRRRRRLLAATGSVGLFGLAGCSSGGDSDDATDPDGTPAGDTQSGDSGDGTEDTSGTNGTDDSTGTDEDADSPDPPDEYVLDLVPGRNEALREQIPDEQLASYEQEFGTDLIEDSTVFADDPGEAWRQLEVDLLALEWWHDNDYLNIDHEEGSQFVESIGPAEQATGMAKQVMISPESVIYPNQEESQYEYGHFDYQEFSSAESVGEALDWLQRYLFNWQRSYDDPGPISTEDELYAAVLQEALDAHTEIESHFWAFDLPEASASTHGNGLIYDGTTNELRVMETISGPETQDLANDNPGYHPLVEDSNYLDENHAAYDSWWHPLRFAADHGQDTVDGHESLDFEDRKAFVSQMFRGIGTGFQDGDIEEIRSESGVAMSTEYTVSIVTALGNLNGDSGREGAAFTKIKQQSKVYNKLWAREESYVIYGTIDDPKYAKVESVNILDAIWNDQAGEYDDFTQHIDD